MRACLSQRNIANYCLDYQSYRIGSPWFSASGNTGIKIVQQNFGSGIWLVISTSKLFSLKSSSKFTFKGSLKNTQLKVKRIAGDSNFQGLFPVYFSYHLAELSHFILDAGLSCLQRTYFVPLRSYTEMQDGLLARFVEKVEQQTRGKESNLGRGTPKGAQGTSLFKSVGIKTLKLLWYFGYYPKQQSR